MSIAQSLIAEIQNESKSTQEMLSRISKDQFGYKPHEKSMDLKSLATHIASIQGLTAAACRNDSFDLKNTQSPQINSTEDLVKWHTQNETASIQALQNISDEELQKPFELKYDGQTIMKMPKGDFIRKMAMSHQYHHRAQLGVYLRMLNVPIPGMYGPSADDQLA